MSDDVAIIGVGQHPFGRFDKTAMEMGVEAINMALADAGMQWKDVQIAYGGSSGIGNVDAITHEVGLTGIPFTNVGNACATSASSMRLAAEAISSGKYDVAIAVGMDKHPRGAFGGEPSSIGLPRWYGEAGLFLTTKFFAMKANKYLHDYDISQRTLARVAAKAFRNGELNPIAFRRKPLSEDEILESQMVNYPLTQYMFCSPDEGAGAVIMCSKEVAARYTTEPIWLKASELRTRGYGAYEVHATSSSVSTTEVAPTVYAARAAFEVAGVSPSDIGVIQLQDTDAGAEIMHMAECGFCEDGEQEKLLAEGATEIGGRLPVNTDGGLLANGEPIGASGMRQVHEIVKQLRGQAGANRQIPGKPTAGFAQVYGAPGTAAATILTK